MRLNALMEKENIPPMPEGIPVIIPAGPSNTKPGGKVPPVTSKLAAGYADALNGKLTIEPTIMLVVLAEVIVGASKTVIVKFCVSLPTSFDATILISYTPPEPEGGYPIKLAKGKGNEPTMLKVGSGECNGSWINRLSFAHNERSKGLRGDDWWFLYGEP